MLMNTYLYNYVNKQRRRQNWGNKYLMQLKLYMEIHEHLTQVRSRGDDTENATTKHR